jgi:prepilin-type N-terminal cleavage/methylation domain-containing protein
VTLTLKTGIKRRSRQPAFTLLELMVVMFIMVVLTGVVAVSLAPALRGARLGSGTRMVLAALRCARDYALAHQTDAAVHLGDEAGGVAVYIRERDEESGEDTWRPLTTPAGRRRPLPEGIEVVEVVNPEADAGSGAAHDPGVTFTALGKGEELRITLRDPRGRTRIIEVDGLTGRCAVAEVDAAAAKD